MAGKYINFYVVLGGLCVAASTFGSAVNTCEDKVLCGLYGKGVCNDDQFDLWSSINCQLFCGKCNTGIPTPVIGVGKIRDETHCQDALSDCARYGMDICADVKFFNWVNDNCKLHCNRCTNECVDKIANCEEYARDNGGETLCSDLQYYSWVQLNCRKFCARCGT